MAATATTADTGSASVHPGRQASPMPAPAAQEWPCAFADRVGAWCISSKSSQYRKAHGLYLTPVPVADFMAAQIKVPGETLRLLVPNRNYVLIRRFSAKEEMRWLTAAPKRLVELQEMAEGAEAGLVFVTAFPNFAEFRKHIDAIAWKTEGWMADRPDHMIHYNGDRFLGPRR